jgi:hypothetical protein
MEEGLDTRAVPDKPVVEDDRQSKVTWVPEPTGDLGIYSSTSITF